MIYILLVCLIVFFAISYLFSGKDYFAPSTVQILTFVGAVFMCIYFMWPLNCPHDFQWKTIGMIAGSMAMSTIIGVIVHRIFVKIEIRSHTAESVNVSHISEIMTFFVMFVLVITIFWTLIEVRRIGGSSGNFLETMHSFHSLHSYSTESIAKFPWLLNQLVSLTNVFFILFGFNLLLFYEKLSIWQIVQNVIIIGLCILTLLLNGSRTPIVNNLIALVIIFHLLRIQKQEGYKQYSFRTFFRIGVLIFLVMAMFFLSKSFVGRSSRNETLNAVDYLAYYTGSGIIALDKYIQRPPTLNNIFGKETFYKLISFLTSYGIVDIPPYLIHLEFRSVGGGFTTNVYTFLRSYHYDFGMAGVFLLHGLCIVFLSVFYEYVKKRRGNIGILTFGMMYYSIVMSFFAERFFSQIFSPNFVKQLAFLLVLYELLIRKRIRLKFRRTAHVLQPIPIQQESHSIDS